MITRSRTPSLAPSAVELVEAAVIAPGQDQPELPVADLRERLNQALVVLVRPQVRRVDDEALRQVEVLLQLGIDGSAPPA